MSDCTKPGPLACLAARLKAAPSRDASLSSRSLAESWDRLREQSLRHSITATPPIMAGLLLHDPSFGQLLDPTERFQLETLVQAAIQRFERKTNPPNTLGRTLTEIISERQ